MGRQIIRSGTSVGAQYREACRARSHREFVSKLESATQELDETCYWIEIIEELRFIKPTLIAPLLAEAKELLAIFVASIRTAKRRKSPD